MCSSRWLLALPLAGLAHLGSGCNDGGISSPTQDEIAPSIPRNLTAQASTPTQIDLSWSASSDNVGVTGYKVFKDGDYFLSTTPTSISDTAVVPSIQYCYAVSAHDGVGNESDTSEEACAETANQAPAAEFTAPGSALPGVEVTFDAGQSSDADGTIVTYVFDFGDGAQATQASPIVTHTYNISATYSVSLSVIDNLGASGSVTGDITIGLVIGQPVNVSNTPTLSQVEFVSGDGLGSISVVWEEFGDDLLFSRSIDGGETFSAPVYVVHPDDWYGSNNHFGAGYPEVVDLGNSIHIVWTIYDQITGGAEVFYSRSTDGGKSWPDPVMLSNDDGDNAISPSLTVDATGTLGVAWGDGGRIYYSYSKDDGVTFTDPVLVFERGISASVALLSPNVFLAWMYHAERPEQVFFSMSTDEGNSFSAPVAIDNYPEKSWGPHLVADAAGNLYVAWQEGPAFDTKIFFAKSAGGESFSNPVVLSDTTEFAVCPFVAVRDGGEVYVSWSLTDRRYENFESFVVVSSDGGTTFSNPLKIQGRRGKAGCVEMTTGVSQDIGLVWREVPAGSTLTDIFYAPAQVYVSESGTREGTR